VTSARLIGKRATIQVGDSRRCCSADVRAARPKGFESFIPILQGLTRFLSRFHVRQHGEKLLIGHAGQATSRDAIILTENNSCQLSSERTTWVGEFLVPKSA